MRFLENKYNIKDRITQTGKEKRRIIKDPDLLLEKLKEGSDGRDLWDQDEKLEYAVVEKDGHKTLELERTQGIRPGSVKEKPKEKETKSKKKKGNKDEN